MNAPAIMWQGDNITILVEGKPKHVSKNSHPNYLKIVEAIKNKEWESVVDLCDFSTTVKKFTEGNITIENGVTKFKGRKLDKSLNNALNRVIKEGLPYENLIKFIDNLMENPSNRSVESLYTFIEKYDMPITDDGCFMAYKSVEDGYLSRYKDEETGESVKYEVGDKPSMPRNLISDDPKHACHKGLHACSFEYLQSWGGKHLMLVKINPKDVVCVPYDCQHQKLRVCEMEVISEVFDDNGDPWFKDVLNDNRSNFESSHTIDEDEIERIRAEAFQEGYDEGYSDASEEHGDDG